MVHPPARFVANPPLAKERQGAGHPEPSFHLLRSGPPANRYDLVVRSWRRFWKVQVKACGFIAFGNYRVYAERIQRGRAVGYTADEIDFLAVYIILEDTWFIVPVRAFAPLRGFHLYPRGAPDGGRFEQYRDAWWLLE